jgi:hypothetical protein
MKLKSFAFAEIFEDILFNSEGTRLPQLLCRVSFLFKKGQNGAGVAHISAPCNTAQP